MKRVRELQELKVVLCGPVNPAVHHDLIRAMESASQCFSGLQVLVWPFQRLLSPVLHSGGAEASVERCLFVR